MPHPTRFGRYWLTEKLAVGGMAEIFKGKLVGIEGFEKTLVIKRILPSWSEHREFIRMLVDEAKVLVHLNHPNIVQVYELGKVELSYFIAMEYVEGVDLKRFHQKLLKSGQSLAPELAIHIILETLQGLAYAHERELRGQGKLDIVHRDISPQNILISLDGEVKVSDFGIAKAATQNHETQTGVLKGKYAYMSPEQSRGKELDAKSDLFSVAVVLYELLLERRLFAGANDLETLDRVRRTEIPWPENARTKISPELKQVLQKALAQKPEDRYAHAAEFAEALESCSPQSLRNAPRRLAEKMQELFSGMLQQRQAESTPLDLPEESETPKRETKALPTEEATVSLVENQEFLRKLSPPPHEKSSPKPYRRYVVAAAALALLTGSGILWQRSRDVSISPNPNPTSVTPATLATTTPQTNVPPLPETLPQTPEKDSPSSDSEEKDPTKAGTGIISISADPWGQAAILGKVARRNTPIGPMRLPEGRYTIRVFSPVGGPDLIRQAQVRAGKNTVCKAEFNGVAVLRCF